LKLNELPRKRDRDPSLPLAPEKSLPRECAAIIFR